jgi:hypothetical protein
MTAEIILLALAGMVRPTSLAAVYAIVAQHDRARLMLLYTTAGLLFTVAFGVLVVWVLNGVDINAGTSRTKGIAELIGGTLALGFGLLVWSGRISGPQVDDAPDAPSRWSVLLAHRITVRSAIVAGPATHIPGLFYLIALNVIIAHRPDTAGGIAEVLIYNAIWFAIPLATLVLCVLRPAAARDLVGAVNHWTRTHARAILIGVSLVVGAGLLIRAIVTI